MQEAGAIEIAAWLTDAALTGTDENDLLNGFCERLIADGVPLSRAGIIVDTLHPVHEGRVFRWRRYQNDDSSMVEYGRMAENDEAYEHWRTSPFYHLLETGGSELRRNMARGDLDDFPILTSMREQGQTDYLALIHRFGEAGTVGQMDCIYSSWSSDAGEGFDNDEVAMLSQLAPTLALAVKCASLQRIAGTLVETYLGRDAGRRVLNGRIERGVADKVPAVLWSSDLRGYTHISDSVSPEQIIPLLNDYAEAAISSIHAAGGDVLKLIGDGILAVFDAADPAAACRRALDAEAELRARIAELNRRRSAENLPVTDTYLALHIGYVFYGNIGSHERLDFTVIGPSVNLVSRIATMCRSAERTLLLSSEFRAAAPEEAREQMVSVGRYALRGLDEGQELFTILRPAAARV